MMRKCFWRPEEDLILKQYVETYGEGNWATVSKESGLKRGGKSCRLRWKNYLRPNVKRGAMSEEEVDLIIRMHKLLGNRWSLIAGRIPGRTDNEVKNYWNTHLNKKCTLGKRRSSLDSNSYNHIKKDDRKSNNGKRNRKIRDGTSPGTYNEEMEGKKEEKTENAVADIVSWIQDSMGFNTHPESPIVPDHNVIFGLEGDPLGSFVFCETFEFSGEDVPLQETDLFSA